MIEHNKQHKDLSTGWTVEDKKMIATMILPLAEMQKAYGRILDVKLVMSGWEMALSGLYTADQICYALKEYVLKKSDFPTPADINNILNPPKPRITEAEFVRAQKWQENNGYPIFSEALDVIKGYKEQEQGKRTDYKSKCESVNAITKQAGDRLKCLPK